LARSLACWPINWASRSSPGFPVNFGLEKCGALISDISRIAELGFAPQTTLEQGIDRYLNWIRSQGEIKDYFAAAERSLRRRKIVKTCDREHSVTAAPTLPPSP